MSVTNSAYQQTVEPENRYLLISEKPAWDLLEKLAVVHPRFAHYMFRNACHFTPCPDTVRVTDWLKRNKTNIGPMVEPDLASSDKLTFDLSVGSLQLGNLAQVRDPATLSQHLFGQMKDVKVGIGRYNEVRGMNTSDVFRIEGNNGPEWRTIHLGLDLFQEPGSPIFAPLEGTVHSFRNNNAPFDYGPTLILQHATDDGIVFFTLYGHLSVDSLSGLREGKPIRRGDPIAKVGTVAENGGWPPHLHFQIITDLLDKKADFTGVALPGQRSVWLSLCPDPNLIALIPEGSALRQQ